jgi:DNA-binding NarL/FixJ family response regulator
MSKISVLLADDHVILRAGVAALLQSQPDMQVVAEAGEVGELLRLAGELHPDVAVLDIAMPGGGGLKALDPLKKVAPQCRVVILTMHTDRALVLSSIAAGASGYLVKSSDFAELRDAIRRVHRGKTYFSVPMDSEEDVPLPAVTAVESPQLSPREREVVRLLALGFTYREMATQLGISERSVETYRARVAQKLGLEGRAAVVRYALSTGLLDGEAP